MKKNKINLKEQRAQQAQNRLNAVKEKENAKLEEQRAKEKKENQEREAIALERALLPNEKSDINIKSKAKASGLKSSFVIGDEVVMTSFGKGNSAVPEKRKSES